MRSGVAEIEFEEDEGKDSVTGVCKAFLREKAMVDMLKSKAG